MLTYEFYPASKHDGITVTIPLASLNAFSEADFDCLVPSMLPEKNHRLDAVIAEALSPKKLEFV